MSGYGQFCPVAKASEVFAERWTPLLLRELLCESHHFSQLLQGLPRMSQSLLAKRLKSLEREGVIERRPARGGRGWEYHLTPAGREFAEIVERLGEWGQRWAIDDLGSEDLDAGLLMWAMHRNVARENLPEERVVIRFEFRGPPKELWWLILKRPEVDVCLKDPGYEVDLYVTADLMALTKVYLGRLRLEEAIERGW
jgi:DNA-binding HxlR family transcriptional regulator